MPIRTGRIRLLLIGAVLLLSKAVLAYVPPLGIPTPSFGIDETHRIYESKNRRPTEVMYHEAGNGPFTHYVDNTSPTCIDENNPFGIPVRPRCTVPEKLQPGSVVELHGGPYRTLILKDVAGSVRFPIFIRGFSEERKIRFTDVIGVDISATSYVILENLLIDGSAHDGVSKSQAMRIRQPAGHISIRNSEIRDYAMPVPCAEKNGRACWNAAAIAIGANALTQDGQLVSDIVLYKNDIHDIGDFPRSYEGGRQGIMIGSGSQHVWILENRLARGSDDGIHVMWRPNGKSGPIPRYIYIGKNVIGPHGENAVDIKQSFDVVVTQNTMHGYRPTDDRAGSGSDGAAIVVNNDDPNDRIWILFNDIHDASKGIRNQSQGNVYVIGNVIRDLVNGESVAIESFRSRSISIVNNTIDNAGTGVFVRNGFRADVINNIITNVAGSGQYVWLQGKKGVALHSANNLLYSDKGVGFIERLFPCKDCILQSPQYMAPKNNSFRLSPDSPAINAASPTDVYRVFFDLYGIDINFDFEGKPRSVKPHADIGAYLYAP